MIKITITIQSYLSGVFRKEEMELDPKSWKNSKDKLKEIYTQADALNWGLGLNDPKDGAYVLIDEIDPKDEAACLNLNSELDDYFTEDEIFSHSGLAETELNDSLSKEN